MADRAHLVAHLLLDAAVPPGDAQARLGGRLGGAGAEDRLEDFDEYTTTLSTCNEMNPAQNDPGNFQVGRRVLEPRRLSRVVKEGPRPPLPAL